MNKSLHFPNCFYRVAFKDYDFTVTEECQALSWFSPAELPNILLDGQMLELPNHFRLEDFTEDF